MIRIWTKNISPNFILKEVLEILCRRKITQRTLQRTILLNKVLPKLLQKDTRGQRRYVGGTKESQ